MKRRPAGTLSARQVIGLRTVTQAPAVHMAAWVYAPRGADHVEQVFSVLLFHPNLSGVFFHHRQYCNARFEHRQLRYLDKFAKEVRWTIGQSQAW